MSDKSLDFKYSNGEEPHIQRTKDIIRKYPEIKKLMGRYPENLFICIFCGCITISNRLYP